METGTRADGALRQFLSFVLDGEVFAIDVAHVREILDRTDTTRVPRMPAFVLGVLNVRGSVVPVVDLRVKFGMKPTPPTPDTCVVVVEVAVEGEVTVVGAMVDAVREVFEIDEAGLSEPPRIGTKLDTEFIDAMAKTDDGFLIVLDIDRVFSVDEIIAVRRTAGSAEEEAAKAPAAAGRKRVPKKQ